MGRTLVIGRWTQAAVAASVGVAVAAGLWFAVDDGEPGAPHRPAAVTAPPVAEFPPTAPGLGVGTGLGLAQLLPSPEELGDWERQGGGASGDSNHPDSFPFRVAVEIFTPPRDWHRCGIVPRVADTLAETGTTYVRKTGTPVRAQLLLATTTDVSTAEGVAASLQDVAVIDCLREVEEANVAASSVEASAAQISFEPLELREPVGASGQRMTVTGPDVTYHVDFAVVRRGAIVATLVLEGSDERLDRARDVLLHSVGTACAESLSGC